MQSYESGQEECVQCTRASRGEYMGLPCCMNYECMNEIKELEDISEKIAKETFGKWLKFMFKKSTRKCKGDGT